MFKTISETAKELNVTKQCIYKKLSTLKEELNGHVNVEKGVKTISKEGIEIIKNNLDESPFNFSKIIKNKDENEKLYTSNINDKEFKKVQEALNQQYENRIKQLEDTVEYLKKESESKNRQLETKDKLLENMQVLLKDQKELIERKSISSYKKKWWPFKKDST
jgi:hypothetical protein